MNQMIPLFGGNWAVIIIILVWTAFWKGYAMWTAAKSGQVKWFVVLLLLNTFGILEIIYIFFVAKKNWHDIKAVFVRKHSLPEEMEK